MKFTVDSSTQLVKAKLDRNMLYEFSSWNYMTKENESKYAKIICDITLHQCKNFGSASVAMFGVAAGGIFVELYNKNPDLTLVGIDDDKKSIDFCVLLKPLYFPTAELYCQDGFEWANRNTRHFTVIINDMFKDVRGNQASIPITSVEFFKHCFAHCDTFIQQCVGKCSSILNQMHLASQSLPGNLYSFSYSGHTFIIFNQKRDKVLDNDASGLDGMHERLGGSIELNSLGLDGMQELSGGSIELKSIEKSDKSAKKFKAKFVVNGRPKTTYFGASGMDDYTRTHNTEQRERYRKRHAKDLSTKDPTRAGFLSYYILWGDSTNMEINIREYKKKFKI